MGYLARGFSARRTLECADHPVSDGEGRVLHTQILKIGQLYSKEKKRHRRIFMYSVEQDR
jgi:hypothetical protein